MRMNQNGQIGIGTVAILAALTPVLLFILQAAGAVAILSWASNWAVGIILLIIGYFLLMGAFQTSVTGGKPWFSLLLLGLAIGVFVLGINFLVPGTFGFAVTGDISVEGAQMSWVALEPWMQAVILLASIFSVYAISKDKNLWKSKDSNLIVFLVLIFALVMGGLLLTVSSEGVKVTMNHVGTMSCSQISSMCPSPSQRLITLTRDDGKAIMDGWEANQDYYWANVNIRFSQAYNVGITCAGTPSPVFKKWEYKMEGAQNPEALVAIPLAQIMAYKSACLDSTKTKITLQIQPLSGDGYYAMDTTYMPINMVYKPVTLAVPAEQKCLKTYYTIPSGVQVTLDTPLGGSGSADSVTPANVTMAVNSYPYIVTLSKTGYKTETFSIKCTEPSNFGISTVTLERTAPPCATLHTSCLTASDCCSGYCCSNICQSSSCPTTCASAGQSCTSISCCSGYCCSGVCQSASCGGGQPTCTSTGESCSSSASCCSGYCCSGVCSSTSCTPPTTTCYTCENGAPATKTITIGTCDDYGYSTTQPTTCQTQVNCYTCIMPGAAPEMTARLGSCLIGEYAEGTQPTICPTQDSGTVMTCYTCANGDVATQIALAGESCPTGYTTDVLTKDLCTQPTDWTMYGIVAAVIIFLLVLFYMASKRKGNGSQYPAI